MSSKDHAGHVLMELAKSARGELGARHQKTGRALEAVAAAVAAQGKHVASSWVADFSHFMHAAHGRKGKH